MDRSAIMRHLLSDETDPFNRQRLTPDMLVPQVSFFWLYFCLICAGVSIYIYVCKYVRAHKCACTYTSTHTHIQT